MPVGGHRHRRHPRRPAGQLPPGPHPRPGRRSSRRPSCSPAPDPDAVIAKMVALRRAGPPRGHAGPGGGLGERSRRSSCARACAWPSTAPIRSCWRRSSRPTSSRSRAATARAQEHPGRRRHLRAGLRHDRHPDRPGQHALGPGGSQPDRRRHGHRPDHHLLRRGAGQRLLPAPGRQAGDALRGGDARSRRWSSTASWPSRAATRPRIVEEKLKSFLSPTLRRKVDDAKEKAA